MLQLSRISFPLFWVAVGIYLAAMVGFFAFWAFRHRRLAIVSSVLMAVGWLIQGISDWSRALALGRPPVGDLYEYSSTFAWLMVAVALFLIWRYRMAVLAGPILLGAVMLMSVGAIMYVPPGPLVPALRSYWISIHVTSMVFSSALFAVAFIVTLMGLQRVGAYHDLVAILTRSGARDKPKPSPAAAILEDSFGRPVSGPSGGASVTGQRSAMLPRAAVLEELSNRFVMLAFPIWWFGIMAGALWAEQAWHSWWSWDPKETTALITGLTYAIYLHVYNFMGIRGRTAAYVQLAGFACLLFTLYAVNLWIAGLHSYAR